MKFYILKFVQKKRKKYICDTKDNYCWKEMILMEKYVLVF